MGELHGDLGELEEALKSDDEVEEDMDVHESQQCHNSHLSPNSTGSGGIAHGYGLDAGQMTD